jgi:hypothetical protein
LGIGEDSDSEFNLGHNFDNHDIDVKKFLTACDAVIPGETKDKNNKAPSLSRIQMNEIKGKDKTS